MKHILLFILITFNLPLIRCSFVEEQGAICLQILNEAAHGTDQFIDEPVGSKWCAPVTSNCFAGATGGAIAKTLCLKASLPCFIVTETLATLGWIRSCSKLKDNRPRRKTLLNRRPTNLERISAGLCGCALVFQPQICFMAAGAKTALAFAAADYVSGKQRFMRPGG